VTETRTIVYARGGSVRPSFILSTLINAAALWVATRIVPGVEYTGGWLPMLGVAILFGALNTFIGRLAKILALPLIIVTLGFFMLVINGWLLWLTSALSGALGLGFSVGGFWPAFWGGLVVSIVSTVLGLLVVDTRARA
jgi:putative membrane protein